MRQNPGKAELRSRLIGALRHLALAIILVGASAFSALASTCRLGNMAEFPIAMSNLRPLMSAKINDTDVQLLVDSGAFYSMLSGAAAAELNLPMQPAPFG